jgi:hypothetical protein
MAADMAGADAPLKLLSLGIADPSTFMLFGLYIYKPRIDYTELSVI